MTCTTGNCPPPADKCAAIRKKIDEAINRDKRAMGDNKTHGLKHRFPEQIRGANGPGTQSWTNHHNQIVNQQKHLDKLLKELIKNRCGPPPPGARTWATRPAPKPSEWVGPATSPSPSVLPSAETATKVVATVGIGYLIYRGVRMLPSLFPPAWPTIPANLAIP
ncbi:hypothetical protein ASD8599_00600 [Ascidiaceihabitans donghaensis]|uniref:Tox-WTIP domain-containing protein n=1 Tax=Ascidiaceihabitans donghaensis TaxID=1510460 RepID=A0A2R8B9Z6_9RHOB|nr:hypothetical protein [Ascidiaceihabitans donghaensis]SPH19860.1 hypothetical protein ASD8599_00600 [Ascidiaceihabitans donghaensis]